MNAGDVNYTHVTKMKVCVIFVKDTVNYINSN